MSFIAEYGLFLAKIVTVVVAIIALAVAIVSLSSRQTGGQRPFQLGHPADDYQTLKQTLAVAKLPDPEQ